ncbi:short-chain collagen C4-like [Lytechinus pictus]|uniref:short-chain collagen C4-like n=1 Tax=Lytechinus pictus TaxID=7653 RepID=UPI0030B9FBE5
MMKSVFVASLLLFSSLYLFGVSKGVAVSKGDPHDENSAENAPTEEDKISQIGKQILFLQESVAEITRSFSTLKLIAKNPSVMAKIHVPNVLETELGEATQKRLRRELDSPSTLPTSFPSPDQTNQLGLNHFGPYSWPMYSGQCFLCPAGVPGQRGPPGPQGVPGRDGRDGRDAPADHHAHETGTQTSPTEPSSNPEVRPVGNMTSLPGAIYIRWGNDECPSGADLIYSGTIGGAHYTQSGSGSNHLCMPDEPIYDEVETSLHAERALLYSSEYQLSTGPSRIQPMHDHTPTCAVCRAPSGRPTKLMIPARNVCPSEDWRLEYAGYIMSEKYTHKRSEFVCVDREMVPTAGTHGDQNGVLLYLTEVRCLVGGGLDCGPYIDGYEITCAVCTI